MRERIWFVCRLACPVYSFIFSYARAHPSNIQLLEKKLCWDFVYLFLFFFFFFFVPFVIWFITFMMRLIDTSFVAKSTKHQSKHTLTHTQHHGTFCSFVTCSRVQWKYKYINENKSRSGNSGSSSNCLLACSLAVNRKMYIVCNVRRKSGKISSDCTQNP